MFGEGLPRTSSTIDFRESPTAGGTRVVVRPAFQALTAGSSSDHRLPDACEVTGVRLSSLRGDRRGCSSAGSKAPPEARGPATSHVRALNASEHARPSGLVCRLAQMDSGPLPSRLWIKCRIAGCDARRLWKTSAFPPVDFVDCIQTRGHGWLFPQPARHAEPPRSMGGKNARQRFLPRGVSHGFWVTAFSSADPLHA